MSRPRRPRAAFLLLALLAACCFGCTGGEDGSSAVPAAPSAVESPDDTADIRGASATSAGTIDRAAATSDDQVTIVFLGDSLTAGFGLAEEQAFPALVGDRLEERGIDVRVVNAGVSGDTTAGGLARLDWLLSQSPDVLVVGLGGNDGLRGLEIEEMKKNLRAIVERARERGARVLLLGMKMPPNYGRTYTEAFEDAYREVAAELDVPLVPFLLEGVGGVPELNLPDGIHPNAEGQRVLADNVEPHLVPLVEDDSSPR